MKKGINRREIIKQGGTALGLGWLSKFIDPIHPPDERLKVVITGGHPDDPETGCGGLIAMLTKDGHRVSVGYLTRGEAGIPGTSHEQAASLRTKEATTACDILGAEPFFLGQVDGDTVVNQTENQKMLRFLQTEKPDLLFTHWPIDTHRDHRACSALTYGAWLQLEKKPLLFFYEVMSGNQTQQFSPTDYVDITSVVDLKHKACFAHTSQKIAENYASDHGKMESFRGLENNCLYAEAFISQMHNHRLPLH